VTCFALLLSFVGTILGGIWADQSWGRFWGWDPKENGAMMIVLWGAILLHARWGKLIEGRGIAALAVLGNVVTCWSWFGVNMLGAGLHSYGFIDSAAFWLIAFVVTQIAIASVALIPRNAWASFAPVRVRD
jgi:ABC-type transport system involved in cytochrome c biogenesis permease subunit